MTGTDIYPVGLLADWKHHRWGGVRRTWRYVKRQSGAGNWRSVRNTFNGYLAEHDNCPHGAGRGWTRRAALRRVTRICRHRFEGQS